MARSESKPKFRDGDLIRYGSGSTALMRVTTVSSDHAGPGAHRYYGEQLYGGSCGAYETSCIRATGADHRMWRRERKKYRVAEEQQ